MAPDPVTQERIYRALKMEYLDGHFVPGSRIDIASIADRLRASATPVREAIHRLIGEELLEQRPDGGVRLVAMETAQLSHLYAWSGQIMLAALHIAPRDAVRAAVRRFRDRQLGDGPLGPARLVGDLFAGIAEATENPEFVSQVQRTGERLCYARIAETRVLPDVHREIATMMRNGEIDVRQSIRRRIGIYHRRRIEHAAPISRHLRSE